MEDSRNRQIQEFKRYLQDILYLLPLLISVLVLFSCYVRSLLSWQKCMFQTTENLTVSEGRPLLRLILGLITVGNCH